MANDSNFVLSQELPSGPDNDIIGNGLSSGNPMYDLSDSANQQTWTPADTRIARPGPALDSDNTRLLMNRHDKLLMVRGANPFIPIQMIPLTNWTIYISSGATDAMSCPIPSGAKMACIRVANGTAIMSAGGKAVMPTLNAEPADMGGGIALAPGSESFFYCEETMELSFRALNLTAALISVSFFSQQ